MRLREKTLPTRPIQVAALVLVVAVCATAGRAVAEDASGGANAGSVGTWLLGSLFGYFLVYSINAGSKAVDALKSLLGVVGIASGGLLSLWPSPSDHTDVAIKLLDSATKLATAVQPLAGKPGETAKLPPEFVAQISGMLKAAAKVATTNTPESLVAEKMGVLNAYSEGAVLGFVIYVVVAVGLAALYSPNYKAKEPLNCSALLAETLAKTLLGEDFRPAPVQ